MSGGCGVERVVASDLWSHGVNERPAVAEDLRSGDGDDRVPHVA
jgi:hypothetical protein